jgi:hypothetical protein
MLYTLRVHSLEYEVTTVKVCRPHTQIHMAYNAEYTSTRWTDGCKLVPCVLDQATSPVETGYNRIFQFSSEPITSPTFLFTDFSLWEPLPNGLTWFLLVAQPTTKFCSGAVECQNSVSPEGGHLWREGHVPAPSFLLLLCRR